MKELLLKRIFQFKGIMHFYLKEYFFSPYIYR